MDIPKIIHQTWKDDNVPIMFENFVYSWKQYHSDWNYILWTDAMNLEFIKTHYPEFLSIYINYTKNIQRTDLVRYLILHKYGGLYVDLDFECLQNIEPLLQDCNFLIGKEPSVHCQIHNCEILICNAFIASTPNSNFINKILNDILNFKIVKSSAIDPVLETTGPFMINRVYNSYKSKFDIKLIDSVAIYPLTKYEALELWHKTNIEKKTIKNELLRNGTFAIHYFWGSWWRMKDPFKKIIES